ncbi:MAG: carboxymuconolactone decarboxylase family protein [Jiangellaceae bacterium]
MTWIRTVVPDEAQGQLRVMYDRIRGPSGGVDNILIAHSLRPHTLAGHLGLYKSTLHHSGNRLPASFLEIIGVHVSHLNGCHYCVRHHAAGLERLLDDRVRCAAVLEALQSGRLDGVFDEREIAALGYARRLTLQPWEVSEADIDRLRAAGYDDGEILEVNQVVSYFAYANRTVLGLGVTTAGDVLGNAPSDSADADDWRHR